jgi:hypothetical protein
LTGFSGGTGGSINTIVVAPIEGQGGIGTTGTDQNTLGTFLYDNTGFVGNPLNMFFTNGSGGYFEPGLPVRPFNQIQPPAVSDSGVPAAPTLITAPVITGTPQVGQTLTVSNGTWTGSPTGYTYHWPSGATTATYVPVSGDVGNTLTATVTATNAVGPSSPATSNPAGPVTSSGSGCLQATNYLARTSGGNEGGNAANITTLICGLVADGVITGDLSTTGCGTTLDVLYIFAQQNSTDALLNLCGTSHAATTVGAVTFTTYTGYSGFGGGVSGKYLSTNYNASTAGGNYAQNSGSIGVWPDAVFTEVSPLITDNGGDYIYPAFTGNVFYARVNNGSTGSVPTPGLPTTKGEFVGDRSSSASVVPYWDGIAQTAQTGTSSAPTNATMIIGSDGTNPGTNEVLSEAHIGASLGSLNLAMYNRLRTYMTAVGVP